MSDKTKKGPEKLKKEEMDLIAKKQVMEKEDYKKEIEKLRKKASNFAKDRKEQDIEDPEERIDTEDE